MNPELPLSETFEKLGIALALGLLVGIQRQRTDSRLAGIRTFPLVTMLGTVTALLALRFGGWMIAAGLLSLAAVVIIGNLPKSKVPPDPGVTSEVTLFLMFGVGAYLVAGHALVAVALVGTVALLLHLKPQMHHFARKLGERDFKAIMQFVLISLVILPLLPNEAYGPYKVLNPHKIWLLVVLIVAISLGGYVAQKLLGERGGSIVAGLLGGLISSTATTVSYSRRSKENPAQISMAALVIMVASATVFFRVLVIAGITAPQQLPAVAGPIGTMFAAVTLIAGAAWLLARGERSTMPEHTNPTELKSALVFALLFAVVLLGVAAAKDHFGTQGLYVVSALSGLTDMDAITLSTLQTSRQGGAGPDVAWRMILVASMANLVFKGAMVAAVGSRKLFAKMAVLFGIAFIAGLLILWLWPAGKDSPQPAASPAAVANSESESSGVTAPGPKR